ncbi:hypothetical protein Clacol_002783 [Clathrus columnatus]|uniref:C2 PI3K-type domain-containing protein n=1 Tax=Clathrus columnatus TaxID=1419009 RepID=A0AAV5A1R1_9AGAM|nr:hypothetical protein Clacol_002783 [Clathrus columnatus]
MDKDNPKDFTFVKLSDLKVNVTFRISELEGTRRSKPFSELPANPELLFHGAQLPGLSDLYVACQLFADNKPLTVPYRTAFKSFKTSYITLRRGKHRLLLWKDQEADGFVNTQTPSKLGLKDEMGRLEKLVKKHERGDLPKSDWLDKMTFRRMEEIHAVSSCVDSVHRRELALLLDRDSKIG